MPDSPHVDSSVVADVPGPGDSSGEGQAADTGATTGSAEPAPHPFANLSNAELEAMLLSDSAALGSMSVGNTSGGAQFNAVQMPEGDNWKLVNPKETWGTSETVEALAHCINRVNEQFADTPRVFIGDISSERGGYLSPHQSHQSGRDVDVGYYYTTPQDEWYERATVDNLDVDRTWAFVRAMIVETDVEWIFIDRSLLELLRAHALAIGEDAGWLDDVFGSKTSTTRSIFLHQPGHATHIHVRFYNRIAQETGRRLYDALVKHDKISPPTYYVEHKARKGETLNRLAKKYQTTVKALKKANSLRSDRIYIGHTYKIPRQGGVKAAKELRIPPRRVPPTDPQPA